MEKDFRGYGGSGGRDTEPHLEAHEDPRRPIFRHGRFTEALPFILEADRQDEHGEDEESEKREGRGKRLGRLFRRLFAASTETGQESIASVPTRKEGLGETRQKPAETSLRDGPEVNPFVQRALSPDILQSDYDDNVTFENQELENTKLSVPPSPVVPSPEVLRQFRQDNVETGRLQSLSDRFSSSNLAVEAPSEGWGRLATVGVILESVGRRRADRKLKQRIDREVRDLRKDSQQEKDKRQHLEAEHKTYKSQLEAFQRQSFEQAAAHAFEQRRVMPGNWPSEPKQKEQQLEPSSAVASTEKAEISPQTAPNLNKYKREVSRQSGPDKPVAEVKVEKSADAHAKPNIITERVATAEQSMPVERVHERRQEVKDEPGRAGAASVGSVLSGAAGSYNLPNYITTPPLSSAPPPHDFRVMQKTQHSYHSAVKKGFGAAVIVVLLGILIYILFAG